MVLVLMLSLLCLQPKVETSFLNQQAIRIIKGRIGHCVHIVKNWVILLTCAISCIGFHQGLSSRTNPQWHIKCPASTPNQYQQLLALIDASNSSIAATSQTKEVPMANVASSSNTAMVGIDFSHSVFSTQVVNRRAYGRHTWVLDIGAIDHFVCSVDLLTTITATMQSLVQLLNGESAQVTYIRTVVLSSSLTLKNAICVPSFTFNLLSVSTITQSQPYCLVFLSTYFFVQDFLSWKTIGVGKAIDGLYLLQ